MLRGRLPDPAIEFFDVLSELPNHPSHLTFDRNAGDLWFPIFVYAGGTNKLYRYSVAKDELEVFEIPASTGSELMSSVAVDGRGHIIVAEGFHVIDFDPSSGTHSEIKVDEVPARFVQWSKGDAAWITDMAIDDGLVYVSRLNSAAITRIDLATGVVDTLNYPESFGPAYELAPVGDDIWITSRWDIAGGPPAQTGRIDLKTGSFTLSPGKASALAAGSSGIYAIEAGTGAAVAMNATSVYRIEGASAADGQPSASGVLDFIALDEGRSAFWAAGEGQGRITRIDLVTGSRKDYQLPTYVSSVSRCPPPPPGEKADCPEVTLKTKIRGLTVAPDGDLYFADATLNRIGIIKPSKD